MLTGATVQFLRKTQHKTRVEANSDTTVFVVD